MSTSASYATVVQELYVAYFGRPADPIGLQNFEAALAAAKAPTTLAGLSAEYATNPAVASLVNAFGNSAESGRLYGTAIASSTAAAQQFVTSVFEDLFNRPPLQAGLAFWSNALTSGAMTPGEAAMEIALGAATADAATFNNKIAAASTFTADLIADNATPGYSGPVAAADARAFLAGITGSTTAATYQAGATVAIDNMLGISPTPTPTPAPGPSTMALTVAGDTIHLSNTTAASTVSLSGADLTAYPASPFYGTLGGMVSAGIVTVTDSGGNFTLNASGNSSATAFNFGTGVVSGSDPASSTGITFGGVTTYVTSTHADTVTLSAATQNVTASNDTQTINLGNLAYTGTLNLTAGSGGTDTINATVGGNLSGATISGTAGHAHINLVLSAGGTETLSTQEYNLITATTAGSITFASGTGSTDHITFSNAGTVTAIANVGNYTLSSLGNIITLNNLADNVDATAGGNDTINLGALAYAGTLSFGSGGTDSVHVTVGGNISGGTIMNGGSAVGLVLSGNGTETMTTSEYGTFLSGGITGGSFGGTTIAFSGSGFVFTNVNVGNYDLSTAGNTVTVNNVADNVTGAASGNDTVNLGALTYTGTVAFGAAGTDTIEASGNSNISGGAITTTGATVALAFTGAGTETMTTAEYNIFNAGGISGGSFSTDHITLSTLGTVTANANVGNYNLSTAGNTITLNSAADNVTGAASGSDTVNLAGLAYTGTLAFGAAGTDTINANVTGNLGGGTITASGTDTVALVLSAAGTETLSTQEYNLVTTGANAGGLTFTGGAIGTDTVTFSNAGTVTAISNVGTYNLFTGTNSITLNNVADNVHGAASGNDVVNLGALTYTGTLAFGAAGTDTVNASITGDIGGGTITASGTDTVALVLSAAGTETLSTQEYNLVTTGVHAGGLTFTGGAIGTDTVAFSDAGTVTAISNVGTYDLFTGTNLVTLNNVADNVLGAASGNDTVDLGSLTYTGAVSFGTSGTDAIHVSGSSDISGGTISSGGAAVSLFFTASGIETMTTEQYNLFNASGISGGSFGGNTIVFTDAGSVIDNADVGNFTLSAAGNTITLNNAADHVTGAASGGDTYNIANTSFTGSLNLGSSGDDTVSIDVSSNANISGGTITSSGTSADLVLSGSGTLTVSSAEAATFHTASSAIVAPGSDTMNVADATSPINLNAQENALVAVGLQAGSNTVNVSVGAASVNAGAAGFNQTISENGGGGNTFNLDNSSATIAGASDATHYVTINGFNTSSDNLVLTLSGVNQNGTSQSISDSGNDTITAANNGVIYLTDLGALSGFVVGNANDLSSAETNILAAVDPTTASTGVYTFVIDTNNGAAMYQTHFTGSTLDGIQLVGVASGVGVFNLVGHIA